jgi:peptide/nickel transport system substrate-binding protein
LAATDPFKQVPEIIGSGPYRFKPDERIAGARLVYERNARYVPRSEGEPDGTTGPKVTHFDRVEWHIMPDPGTAVAAMQRGEIDWWQNPVPDLWPVLRNNGNIKLELINPWGSIATLRFNHLNPPFNNAAMRRALLGAIDQSEHGIAVMGPDPSGWRDRVGFFCPGTPMASEAGMEVLIAKRDLNAAKRAVEAAGYRGERIVVLWATNEPITKALGDVTIDTLKKLDLNIDAQAMDFPTIVQRRMNMEPVKKGGWSLFDNNWGGLDMLIPVGHAYLRGNGKSAVFGWPESPKIEALCNEWLTAPDPSTQKVIAGKLQLQAFEDVPYIPLCQYFVRVACKANLVGVLRGVSVPVF